MATGRPPTSLSKLIAQVGDGANARAVGAVVAASKFALGALPKLDRALFDRQLDGGLLRVDAMARLTGDDDIDGAIVFLRELGEVLWGPTRSLAKVVESMLAKYDQPDASDDDDDFDFDFGGGGNPELESVEEADIDGALGALRPETQQAHQASLRDVAAAVVPISRTLFASVQDAGARLEGAIEARDLKRAIRELDRAREELEEGVFALFESLFGAHGIDVARDELLPGYRSALDEGLMLRRALARLRREVGSANGALQSKGSDDDAEIAFTRIRESALAFRDQEEFVLLRATDRWELLTFADQLHDATFKSGRTTCEGLSKYLESLGAINDRAVLLRHDSEVLAEVKENLAAGSSLVDVSPRGAADLIEECFRLLGKLEGWRDDVDELAAEWGGVGGKIDNLAETAVWAKALLAKLP